ncbi:cytidylyltransferase domain-containing protein [Paramaledivibacter caminithermalis]|uniref:Spore coat polysaccharide biosynthesis protein SpsF n=1 Tax=Paramaledivibacter caminithermalis (strain DSM 15212 / CIP 107654 / DViRD3) TaxID=1121301 RepID=A0A1M6L6Q3_PARC5|nr:glycosyltransferase family protein [Paramaledivibacter caminithermalis]SHJ66901.1 spore coat polysaccharide biosynthesis protein SpsF [Paramaledivibacter caminithermalis DSM 15212]
MKVVAIIQARMGSNRLPGKVLKKICDIPVVIHVVNRVKQCRSIEDIIVATSIKKENDELVDLLKKENIKFFRGSEDDVLGRFYRAAKENKADIILRVTSDNPLIDYGLLDGLVEKLLEDNLDYCCNDKYPIGSSGEAFTFEALKKAFENAEKQYDREHVTPYIKKHKEIFKQDIISNYKDLSNVRITLDTIEDYQFISKIYENLFDKYPYFTTEDIITFLESKGMIK